MKWEKAEGSTWEEGEEQGLNTYHCESCGGEIVADENTAASTCPFCGNPVVMTGKLSGDLRPDILIPFKLDKKAAKAGLMKHFLEIHGSEFVFAAVSCVQQPVFGCAAFAGLERSFR